MKTQIDKTEKQILENTKILENNESILNTLDVLNQECWNLIKGQNPLGLQLCEDIEDIVTKYIKTIHNNLNIVKISTNNIGKEINILKFAMLLK